MLGFTSVYREGFETVLFLQAIVLEAGAGAVLAGVAVGLAATLAVGVLTIRLQRKLPHKKMLMATGLLILWVLVVMVGTTVQTLQVVGWVPVTPVEGLRLPYWAGSGSGSSRPGRACWPRGRRSSSCSAATSSPSSSASAVAAPSSTRQAPRPPASATIHAWRPGVTEPVAGGV